MSKIAWAKSYEAALKKARAGKKLIMIDFYTDWCHFCKKLDAEVYTDPKVIQLSGQLVAVKLHAEREGQDLAQQYAVRGFPTVLYVDAEGTEWGRMPGFLPAPSFLEFTSSILKTYKEQPGMEAKLKQNPGNLALAAELAERYARQKNETKALWAAGLIKKAPQSGKFSPAYIALGDLYIRQQNAPKARAWFQKALAAATDPRNKAYAHMGLAYCFVGERNAAGARSELNAVLKVPGCPSGILENARNLLEQVPK
jgi:thioredoxin-related protein